MITRVFNISQFKLSVLIIGFSIFSMQHLFAQKIFPYLNATVFNLPGEGPYVELYMKVPAYSIHFSETEDHKFQGMIDIDLSYWNQGNRTYSDQYTLASPLIEDTVARDFYLVDVKRTSVPEGDIELKVHFSDRNNEKNAIDVRSILDTHFPDNVVNFSDIQLIDTILESKEVNSFTRGDKDFVPNVINTYDSKQDRLYFYVEAYNANEIIQGDVLYFKYYISSPAGIVDNKQEVQKHKPARINPLYGQFDISDIPTGNYSLVVELYNQKNKKLASNEINFFRNKMTPQEYEYYQAKKKLIFPHYSYDSMEMILDAIVPISSVDEKLLAQNLLDEKDTAGIRGFLADFWTSRNPSDPEKAWKDFQQKFEYVNKNFRSPVQKGYETDRGRIYLKYGEPNQVTKSIDDPNSYPYIIWQYYSIPGQSNVKFVFYNKTNVVNDYVLLHSNARGEIRNDRWEQIIKNRYLDSDRFMDDFGTRPKQDYQ